MAEIYQGNSSPLGMTKTANGWNFALYSEAELLEIELIFSTGISKRIYFDPNIHKSGAIWHIEIATQECFYYKLYIDEQPLLDPYSRLIDSGNIFLQNKWVKDQIPYSLPLHHEFDWQNTHPIIHRREELIIYELHVRGFTKDSSSHTAYPGTFKGMIEKIPYLQSLGVTAVELLPIFEFNETEYQIENPVTKKPLCNFWGYSTLGFFAPMMRYASSNNPYEAITELKTLIRELHKAHIEVILDVVYNHTGEGNEHGPIVNFKAFGDSTYYLKRGREYLNYSGCGNTLNANHPVVQDFIIDSLKYWALEFHIDGFRFDLASILYRGQDGAPINPSPIIQRITQDPILKERRLIAEPWDAAMYHMTGQFYKSGFETDKKWMEWNDDFRTVIRQFIKGTPGYAGKFATKLCGSQDQYSYADSPLASVNYITSHDGFTLRDLVTYQQKHNEENGEHNRDGMDHNDSWNCGEEGRSSNPHVQMLREQQIKNFFLALFLAQGIPMMHSGDEYGHTKKGNNNTWCQDNTLNWFNWTHIEHSPLWHFVQKLISFRKKHLQLLGRNTFYKTNDIVWHGVYANQPDWGNTSQFIAFEIKDKSSFENIFVAFNADHTSKHVELPIPNRTKKWLRVVNTAKHYPDDFLDEESLRPIEGNTLLIAPYSAIVLIQKPI